MSKTTNKSSTEVCAGTGRPSRWTEMRSQSLPKYWARILAAFSNEGGADRQNLARKLKTLKGLAPAQFIWKQWQDKPELFYEEPCHLASGLYT